MQLTSFFVLNFWFLFSDTRLCASAYQHCKHSQRTEYVSYYIPSGEIEIQNIAFPVYVFMCYTQQLNFNSQTIKVLKSNKMHFKVHFYSTNFRMEFHSMAMIAISFPIVFNVFFLDKQGESSFPSNFISVTIWSR